MTAGFIPPHGGYQDVLSYRKALIVFDATGHFCQRFLSHDRRTVDQMVQAAQGHVKRREGGIVWHTRTGSISADSDAGVAEVPTVTFLPACGSGAAPV